MNCERYKEKMVEALASGESSPARDIAIHLRTCEECKRFYEAQVNLFGAIDSGVRAMANDTVPASLLPRVRARIEKVRTPRLVWRPAWSVVAIAAMILVVSLGFVRRSGSLRDAGLIKAPTGVAIRTEAIPFTATPRKAVSAAVNPRRWRGNKTEMRIDRPREVPEVIVLAEEREAVGRVVARSPVH